MTPELLLVLAFVSLAASGAFAYLAYRVWRKKEREEVGASRKPEEEIALGAAAPQTAEISPAQEPKTPVVPPSPVPPPLPSAASPETPAHNRAIPVATLLRDEVTGGLIVRVGEREYRTAGELLVSNDRQRMEYTAAELGRWLGTDKAAVPRPLPVDPAAKPATPRRPTSMVEQINVILDRKLLERPALTRGVRLSEASGGAIKVYVGIDSFNSIDDVPEAEIRQLIREAVAEWEAGE